MVQALLQHLDTPKVSLRMLCAFVAMHIAIEARSGSPPAQPGQLQAVAEKLLHLLGLPACPITATGMACNLAHSCSNTTVCSYVRSSCLDVTCHDMPCLDIAFLISSFFQESG